MSDFLHGAMTLAASAIGLFFLRYWRSTRDRLFAMFSVAFWLLAVHWLLASTLPDLTTQAHFLRFGAFVLIALAIIDKNRLGDRPSLTSPRASHGHSTIQQ